MVSSLEASVAEMIGPEWGDQEVLMTSMEAVDLALQEQVPLVSVQMALALTGMKAQLMSRS